LACWPLLPPPRPRRTRLRGADSRARPQDESVLVLVHGGKKCASPRDLLDIENKRCRVEDKLAKSFLGGERWLKCADFTRGAATLLESIDDAGRCTPCAAP
jgi:hypothetical protein